MMLVLVGIWLDLESSRRQTSGFAVKVFPEILIWGETHSQIVLPFPRPRAQMKFKEHETFISLCFLMGTQCTTLSQSHLRTMMDCFPLNLEPKLALSSLSWFSQELYHNKDKSNSHASKLLHSKQLISKWSSVVHGWIPSTEEGEEGDSEV